MPADPQDPRALCEAWLVVSDRGWAECQPSREAAEKRAAEMTETAMHLESDRTYRAARYVPAESLERSEALREYHEARWRLYDVLTIDHQGCAEEPGVIAARARMSEATDALRRIGLEVPR